VAECLRRSGIAAEVRTAFLEHAPRVEDWHRDIPAGNVVVAPFMISNGTHGAEDVPIRLGLDPTDPALERAAATGQPAGPFAVCGKRLWYCRAAGNEPTVAEIIVAQALAAWRRDRAAAQSRPSARPSNR
jgi:sirohydrochlorin cobaltochelatase